MTNIDRLKSMFNRAPNGQAKPGSAQSVLIVGLGRFGTSLAERLIDLDVEVMAVDIDQSLIDEWADRLTHVRLVDTTNIAALEQLRVQNFDAAVVAIGTAVEASILTTSAQAE